MNEVAVRSEVRVLHFGDVFYGSAFLSPAPEKSAERRRLQTEAFNRMMRYIRDQVVGLALVTGNLFDEDDLSDETATYLIGSLRALPRCRFVIFPGPADPASPDSLYRSGRLPPNVTVWDGAPIVLDDLGITVLGAPDGAPLPVCPPEEGKIRLLCAFRREIPGEGELAATGADFVALSGHPDCRLREANGVLAAFSGSPESRTYDDEGIGGANLLMIVDEAGARRIHVKRLEFGTARCLSRELDVSEMKSEADLITAVTRLIRDNNLGRNAVLRVVLTGGTRPDFRIPRKFDSGSFGLLIFSVLNLTTPLCDQALKKDMSAKGELYRLLEPKIGSGTDAERAAAARALTIGLAALEGREIDNL